jgi:hypothetical protein
MISREDMEAFGYDEGVEEPAARQRDVRYQEVLEACREAFYPGATLQDIFEAMEAISVNQMDLKDLYLIATDIYKAVEDERNR